jgi:UDP:flavonoid glycosyltransferase YjiC (YdhE family)
VVACPWAGDMAENAARVRWAGAGVSLPRRFLTPRGIRLALQRVLSDTHFARAASDLGNWSDRNPGTAAAARAVEEHAGR